MKRVVITVRCEPWLRDRYSDIAALEGCSANDLLCALLEGFAERYASDLESHIERVRATFATRAAAPKRKRRQKKRRRKWTPKPHHPVLTIEDLRYGPPENDQAREAMEAEIDAATARIREGWTDEERRKRAGESESGRAKLKTARLG